MINKRYGRCFSMFFLSPIVPKNESIRSPAVNAYRVPNRISVSVTWGTARQVNYYSIYVSAIRSSIYVNLRLADGHPGSRVPLTSDRNGGFIKETENEIFFFFKKLFQLCFSVKLDTRKSCLLRYSV